ncbi:hypothetical protein MD484_g8357, partial [Candolleomyces efflorescens]
MCSLPHVWTDETGKANPFSVGPTGTVLEQKSREGNAGPRVVNKSRAKKWNLKASIRIVTDSCKHVKQKPSALQIAVQLRLTIGDDGNSIERRGPGFKEPLHELWIANRDCTGCEPLHHLKLLVEELGMDDGEHDTNQSVDFRELCYQILPSLVDSGFTKGR